MTALELVVELPLLFKLKRPLWGRDANFAPRQADTGSPPASAAPVRFGEDRQPPSTKPAIDHSRRAVQRVGVR